MTSGADQTQRSRWDFSLRTWPVRLIYSLIAGTVATVAVSSQLGTAVFIALFAVSTTVAWAVRQR